MPADALATLGASASMALTLKSRNIPSPASEYNMLCDAIMLMWHHCNKVIEKRYETLEVVWFDMYFL